MTMNTREISQASSHELESQQALVEQHLDLAHRLARKYSNYGASADDARQAAAVGLVKAARRYDPDLGVPFVAYAIPTILGELRRFVRDCAWTVRPPRSLQEASLEMRAVREDLSANLSREPRDAEVAKATGQSEAYVRKVRALGSCMNPDILDDATSAAVDDAEAMVTRLAIDSAVEKLAPADRELVHLRFHQDLTQAQIAEHCGTSQAQVSRSLTRIVGQLRGELNDLEMAA